MAEVLNFKGESYGESFDVEPDAILEDAKGELQEVVVVGIHKNGSTYLAGSKGTMNTLWLLKAGEWALMKISEDGDE